MGEIMGGARGRLKRNACAVDNVTHTLAGFMVAELFAQVRRQRGEPVSHWLRPAYLTSAIANNLGDLDFLYAGITSGPLGYLLHHRGHTHTFALAPLMALVAFAVGNLWLRRAASPPTRADRLWLAALALAGPVLHVAMDFSNSYGVHPFWPFYAGWIYGDSVFIVEPLLWATMLPFLIAQVRWWPGRITLGVLLLATVVLPWVSGFVPPALSALVMIVVGAGLLAAFRLRAPARVWAACGAIALVLASFASSSRLARARAEQLLGERFPGAQTHDIVLSPLPANPLCWSLIAIQTQDQQLIERRGALALAPSLIAAARCPDRTRGSSTAPLVEVPGTDRPELAFVGQFQAPLSELRALARQHCSFSALLRFARAPYWKFEGSRLVMGDLRYDRSERLEFAELSADRTPEPASCPRYVPSWLPPRRQLLSQP
jgi:inner membrane protein